MKVLFSLQKSLFNVKKYYGQGWKPGTANLIYLLEVLLWYYLLLLTFNIFYLSTMSEYYLYII